MTAKQYLRQVRDLNEDIEIAQRYYERCMRDIALLKSPRLDGDRVQSSGSGNGFTVQVERLIDLQQDLNKRIDRFINVRDKIYRQIAGMPSPHKELLWKRYIEYKSLENIAEELNYSYQWARELHGIALKAFADKYMQPQ